MENYIHGSVISNAIREKYGDAYSITIDVDDELDLQGYLNRWNAQLSRRVNLNAKEF